MCDNAEWASALFETILHFARSDLDKASAFSLQMAVYAGDSKFDEAVTAGCKAAKLLGWEIDPNVAPHLVILMTKELASQIERLDHAARASGKWPLKKLAELPEMTDAKAKELTKVLSTLCSFTFFTNPSMFALCTIKDLTLALQYGNNHYSCLTYSYFGFYQASLNNFQLAREFGEIAMHLSAQPGNEVMRGRTLLCVSGFLGHWTKPLAQCVPDLVTAYNECLSHGDVMCAGIAALRKVTVDMWSGETISTALMEAEKVLDFLVKRCPLRTLRYLMTSNIRAMLCLTGKTASYSSFDDPGTTPIHISSKPVESSTAGMLDLTF